MRVMLVTLGLPFPPDTGTRIRDFNLLRELARTTKVCLCSLLTEDLPADVGPLQQYCEAIETFRPDGPTSLWMVALRGLGSGRPLATNAFYFRGMADKIRSMIESRRVDVVQIEHSFLACYRDAIPPSANCRTILSFHNVGSLQYRRIASLKTGFRQRLGFLAKAVLMQGWEARIASRFDRSLVVSDEERGVLLKENPRLSVSVIENGVDCQRFRPLLQPLSPPTLLFLGVLSYPPNTDAMTWFIHAIWPHIRSRVPAVQLNIAGHSPPDVIQAFDSVEGVSVKGYVQNPQELYQDACVLIVPLRAGGGTRLKILEAMAFGRVVVSTSIGCEGLAVVPGEHLIVADTADDFAEGVVRVLNDPELRRRMAASARTLVETRYSWEIIGRKVLSVYQATCSGVSPCQ